MPSATFNEETLNELAGDLSELAPLVVRHEAAVRALFEASPTLLPMAFGTLYREQAGVAGFLHDEGGRLRELLTVVRGKQEWGVKVFADVDSARAAAEESSAALRALDDEAKVAAPGRAYLLQRKRDEILAAEIRSFVGQELEAIATELLAQSSDARLDDVPSNQAGPEELVLKAAFLVDADRAESFRVTAGELIDRSADAGLLMEVSGPWPPYSFTGGRS